jgi:sugar lactone lactonase YvrE
MSLPKRYVREEKGFILLLMLFMMLLLAVTAIGINRGAGMQAKMAANQTLSIQTVFGQTAAIEEALWRLNQDNAWRTAPEGEDYVYNGITYTRTVLDSTVPGFENAVKISSIVKGGITPVTVYLEIGSRTFTYFADTGTHRIRRVDSATGLLSTVAGTGSAGFSGDGGQATSAKLNVPTDIATDALGNFYIADKGNYRIRKVDGKTGIITTVAGNGTPGDAGDGGPATSATLSTPTGVYVDILDNIYIADQGSDRIRKVDGTTGIITTVAGVGYSGYSGDNGLATQAALKQPTNVRVDDALNIYIVEMGNWCVRKVDGATGIITTLPTGDLKRPQGACLDAEGNLYIADTGNYRVQKFEAATGIVTTVAGCGVLGSSGDGGPALLAMFSNPECAGIDSRNLYVVDTGNNRIRNVDLQTGIINTFAYATKPSSQTITQDASFMLVKELY